MGLTEWQDPQFKPPRGAISSSSLLGAAFISQLFSAFNTLYTAALSPGRGGATHLLLHFLPRETLDQCNDNLRKEACYAQREMFRSCVVLREAEGEDEAGEESWGSLTCSSGSGNLSCRSERIFPIYAMGNSKPDATSLVGPPASDSVDDPMWDAIRAEAKLETEKEPILSSFLYASILSHNCLERALGFVLANRLQDPTLLAAQLMDIFDNVMMNDRGIHRSIRLDLQAFKDRDPACASYSWAVLYLKGYHSLQSYRVAHALWNQGRKVLALSLQSRISEVFAVDIHPAAKIGEGILLDHATGLVIGETAIVGNKVSLMQGVTLGGTGKEVGDRHPKIGQGALIGAGAIILGNIVVGEGAMIAAGSLVLKNVPPHSMAVGNPAKTVGHLEEEDPSLTMKHDATKDYFEKLAISSGNGKSNAGSSLKK